VAAEMVYEKTPREDLGSDQSIQP